MNEISLEDLVDQYMIGSFNERRRFFLNYVNHAKWIWQSLLLDTIHQYKQKLLVVDKTKDPFEVILPEDCMFFVAVGFVNTAREVRNMAYKNDMPIPLVQHRAGVCAACGTEDSVAAKINNLSVVLRDVVLDGVTYTAKEWTKVLANGDLVLITEQPVKNFSDGENYTITTHKTQQVQCNLEQKPCGCIALSDANISSLRTYCGWTIPVYAEPHGSQQRPYEGYGFVRQQGNKLYLQGDVPDCVIVTYRTNGMCANSEIMIPIYAAETVVFGTNWRSKALSTISGRLDERRAKVLYETEKDKLLDYLHPLTASEWMDTQMLLPKWGSMQDVDRKALPMFDNEVKAIERKAEAEAEAAIEVEKDPAITIPNLGLNEW